MLRRCAFPAWHFLWFWICSLIRSWLVCVVSILIPCIPGLILICFHIQKSGILSASQIFSKKKKVPKNQHFFTHHPYFLDINTTHSTCLDTLELITYADFFPNFLLHGNKSRACSFLGRNRVFLFVAGKRNPSCQIPQRLYRLPDMRRL